MTTTYLLDGDRFSTLEEFYSEICRVLTPGVLWCRDLDGFNDMLRGGYGTPREGFRIQWINSDRSREVLGYSETIRQLEKRYERCHWTNYPKVENELEEAKTFQGPTVFDWLVGIIREHGVGGPEANNNVELVLE